MKEKISHIYLKYGEEFLGFTTVKNRYEFKDNSCMIIIFLFGMYDIVKEEEYVIC